MLFDPKNYEYTKDWFLKSEIRTAIIKHFPPMGDDYKILEIGCFEGLSTCFFADDYLHGYHSKLICVDPFTTDDKTTPVTNETYKMFCRNIAKNPNPRHQARNGEVSVYVQTSDDYFNSSLICDFHFIYIDGSHEIQQIYRDMTNSLKRLRYDGIMWMDDYLGGSDGNRDIKNIMDKFVEEHKSELEIIHSGYQLGIKRILPKLSLARYHKCGGCGDGFPCVKVDEKCECKYWVKNIHPRMDNGKVHMFCDKKCLFNFVDLNYPDDIYDTRDYER